MKEAHRSGPSPTDSVGEGPALRSGLRPSLGLLAIALLLVAGGLAFLWMLYIDSAEVVITKIAAGPAAPNNSAPSWPPVFPAAVPNGPDVAQRAPEVDADPTRDITSYIMRGENPTMPEVIDRLHKAGVHTGLGAFSPPGTRPPMIGLAVPEDFILPEGYVRHHQATDDGQRIEAILMFAPDHQFFDAAKKPIVIPKDRLVTPELAPPGFPIRRIVVPAPVEAGRSGS